MPNQKNQELVKKLAEVLKTSNGIILAEYAGVNANALNQLRSDVSEVGGYTEVSKNTLLKIAMQQAQKYNPDIEMFLNGQNATFIAQEDAFTILKKLYDFAQTNDKLIIKAGIIESAVYSGAQLEELSKLPSKEVLVAKLLGSLKSPLTGIVNVFSGPQKSLVYALSAIATKKEVA
jgi:large subunit ribosomal protein L10